MLSAILGFLMLLAVAFPLAHAAESWPGETLDTWHGYVRHNFTVDGCPAWVVEPRQSAEGKPWTWCMEFPDGAGGVFGDFASGLSETWQATREVYVVKRAGKDDPSRHAPAVR